MTARETQKEEWFREFYGGENLALATYSDDTWAASQLGFLESAMLRVGQRRLSSDMRVLDQCCGIGCFARALAQKHGNEVVGIDLSEYFIEAAEAASLGSHLVTFVVADAREWSGAENFDICTCWRTSCAYSRADDVNLKQFERMSKSLKKDGLFVIDTINPAYIKKHFRRKWSEIRDDGTIVARWYFLEDGMLSSKWTIVKPDDAVFHHCGMTRLYTREQYETMLANVGLKVVDVVGNYGFDALSDDTGRMIFFGEKDR